jgi:predicted nucleotidyltransferase
MITNRARNAPVYDATIYKGCQVNQEGMHMNNSRHDLERPTRRTLQALAKDIVRKFRPQRIILFGSYAYGQPTRESDVDLLVIMQTTLRPIEQAVAIRQAVDAPFPMDLLVRTPEQIERRLSLGDYFFKEIVSRGRVLYEADHT